MKKEAQVKDCEDLLGANELEKPHMGTWPDI
jgi:hypothetical protein